MHHRKGNLASRFGLVFTGDVPYVLLEEVDPRLQACMGGAEHDLDADVFCPNDDVEDPTTTADHSRGKGVERARRPHEDGEGGPDGEAGDHVKGGRSLYQGGPIDTKRGVGSYSNGAWMLHQGRAHGTSREGAAYVEGEQCVHQAFVSVSTPQQTDPEQDTVRQQTDDQHMGMSKVSRSTTTRDKMNTARSRAETGLRLYSPAIADRIEDWSIEFHDKDHFIQNRTQIMRKWIESGLGEGQFVELMYEARRRAKKALVTKDATDGPSTYGGVKNRMPYFFKTLQDLVDNGLGTVPLGLAEMDKKPSVGTPLPTRNTAVRRFPRQTEGLVGPKQSSYPMIFRPKCIISAGPNGTPHRTAVSQPCKPQRRSLRQAASVR